MREGLIETAEELKLALQEQAIGAEDKFIKFVNDNAKTPASLHQGVAYSRAWTRATDQESKDLVTQKMTDVLDNIVRENEQPEVLEQWSTEQKRVKEDAERLQIKLRAQSRAPVFSCQNISFSYENNKESFHLQNVDLQMYPGQITTVVGENGNGKSTLFRILSGNLKKQSGELNYHFVSQEESQREIDWGMVKANIAYVPERLPKLAGSLREILEYEAAIHGIRGEKNQTAVNYIVERLGLTEYVEQGKKWSDLSAGYQLRFALAKALVWKPRLLIIDEPLANLDIKAQQVVLRDLRNLANRIIDPISIILSSQHLNEIEPITDKIMLLKKGQVAYYDSLANIGVERKTNLLELDCQMEANALLRIFPKEWHVEVIDQQLYFHIHTPVNITPKQVLMKILEADISFNYFRDASKSVKGLFH